MRPGEPVDLTDGVGLVVRGVVRATGPDWLDVDVLRRTLVPAPRPRLVVVQALAKGDVGERAVAALTEVGVDCIVPWPAERSVVRWAGPRGDRSLRRWRAIAAEAAKQSRRAWLPEVAEAEPTDTLARRVSAAALAVVLHEEAGEPLAEQPVPDHGDVVLIVGPEGGVAGEELVLLADAGALPRRLGPTVLRTGTAGVAAIAVVSAGSGRWR